MPVSRKNAAPWWGRIESLWLLAPALCAYLYTLCLPLAPNDFWYHLRAGWWAANAHALPTHNLFSWGVPLEKPYFYQSWISERVLWEVTRHGLSWALLLRAACVTAAVALATAAGRVKAIQAGAREGSAARIAALGGTVTLLIASNNLDLRPQTFSMVLFGVWLLVIQLGIQPNHGRLLWLLPLLAVLWVNTHGAFAAGIGYLGALALGEAISRRRYALGAVSVLCVLTLLLNPHGARIFPYLAQFGDKSISQLYIEEWQSPRLNEWHSALFLLSPLPLIGLAILARRRKGPSTGLPPAEWLAGAALFFLGLREVRAMIWFALWLPSALSALIASCASGPEFPKAEPESPPKTVQMMNAVLLALLLLSTVPLLPWFKDQIPWPPEFRARFASTPRSAEWGFPKDPDLLLDSDTPVAAVEFLRHSPPRGHLWNEMVYGSYLTWALYPKTKPICDPRIELFPDPFWLRYFAVCAGGKEVPDLLAQDGITDVLLEVKQQAPLLHRLRSTPRWKVVYSGGGARILRFQKN